MYLFNTLLPNIIHIEGGCSPTFQSKPLLVIKHQHIRTTDSFAGRAAWERLFCCRINRENKRPYIRVVFLAVNSPCALEKGSIPMNFEDRVRRTAALSKQTVYIGCVDEEIGWDVHVFIVLFVMVLKVLAKVSTHFLRQCVFLGSLPTPENFVSTDYILLLRSRTNPRCGWARS